jgi:hypothetical protein
LEVLNIRRWSPAREDGVAPKLKFLWIERRGRRGVVALSRGLAQTRTGGGQAEQAAIDGLAVRRSRGKAMANEGLINLLGWSRRERERLQLQREMLQSGKFKILKDEGSGPIDVSSQSIAQITANIAELDLILADHDVRSSAPRSIPIDQLNASNDD